VLIIRRSKLHYTASGFITPIDGRRMHETAIYRCDDTRLWTVSLISEEGNLQKKRQRQREKRLTDSVCVCVGGGGGG